MPRKTKPNHGTLNCVRGRYYYKVRLPGTNKRKTYPLIQPGHTQSTTDRRMAIALANKIWDRAEEKKEAGKDVDFPAQTTIKDYARLFFKLRQSELAKTTTESYKVSLGYAIKFFGKDRLLSSITPLDVQKFKAALVGNEIKEANLNRVSANLHIKQMRAIFNYAVIKLDILDGNPFSGMVETIKQSKGWHYVTQEELEAMLEAATEKYGPMIALCRLAALRRLEAFYLTWDNVDFDKAIIHVVGNTDWQPKGRRSRVVPICPELQNILLEAFERSPEKHSRVCLKEYPGNISREMSVIIKRAGLVAWKKPLHTLRKSCITDWASSYPLHVVKEWAGHEDITTTETFYLKVTPDQFEKAAGQSLWSKNVAVNFG